MDIDYPVSNSTNYTVIESEVSEKVSDENTEKQKQTFANMWIADWLAKL